MPNQSPILAGQYLRMSTDDQPNSIPIQRETIQRYAAAHGFDIVATYSDPGKSGLEIGNRPGLRRLIHDITAGRSKIQAILVYDVSRWGRFQDTDEAAHYEFLCRRAGIYKGRLVILIDGVCASFCEDFLMPFKDNHRATLIGQTTAGTFSYTYYFEFGNGMRMNIAATRESFPDGARFEGVGISPDLEIEPSIDDIRSHKDPVLVKAIEVLR